MSRPLLPLAVLVSIPLTTLAADPKPDPVERTLAVQKAMATAEQYLTANQPAEAVAVLETQVSNADGNPGFLPLLRRAYTAELKRLEGGTNADPTRLAEIRRRVNLLGGPQTSDPPAAVPVAAPMTLPDLTPPADGDALLREARELFKQKKYAEAAAKFAAAVKAQATINQDEVAAWAYCRIKVAADTINSPACDPAAAVAAERDVSEALRLVPNNAEFQKVGQSVLTLARVKANGRPAPTGGAPSPGPALPADWETIETASFRVRFKGARELADAVAKAAEAKRAEIYERWSGAPAGPWQPKCEIILHPTADCYAQMTRRPATETGFATVRLSDGRVTERRVELRGDDAGLTTNALPRELTHVVLADLFPDSPPPKWAEEGMAVLAGSPDEAGRYLRTLPRCAREGQLLPVATLLEMRDFPAAERITGFYCQSVSLTDYLIRLKGEKEFKLFLGVAHRYGVNRALRDTYGFDSPQALEAAWKRAALSGS